MRRHTSTDYVTLERSRCEACWSCVEACPNGVLRKVRIGPHRHAHVSAPERCVGCGRCLKACESLALTARAAPAES